MYEKKKNVILTDEGKTEEGSCHVEHSVKDQKNVTQSTGDCSWGNEDFSLNDQGMYFYDGGAKTSRMLHGTVCKQRDMNED